MSDSWQVPSEWGRITTIDAHTAGEPFRVVRSGFPALPGDTILERRRFAMDHLDDLRRLLMWEPRGHADMYGCVVTPPVSERADLGVLFMHNEGFSTMCGHGVIGLVTVALQTGLLPIKGSETPVVLDTPAGQVEAVAFVEGERVQRVRFRNVPSFVLTKDETVDVPELGKVSATIAFGGAFYAFVEADELSLSLEADSVLPLIEAGRAIKGAVQEQVPIEHPFEADLGFLYGTIFTGSAANPAHHSRNVCIFADGEVDRCPTGTGVSARLAIHHAAGELNVGEWIAVESILDTVFTGRVAETTDFGPHPAIVPEIEGEAFITGRHEFLVDPEDPLRSGFILR